MQLKVNCFDKITAERKRRSVRPNPPKKGKKRKKEKGAEKALERLKMK